MDKPKKKVGIFSFTCDEGCSIYLTEIFNTKLLEWLEVMEIVYFLSVKDHSEVEELDIALVEGVISTEKDKQKIGSIRAKTTTLIAMGTCAITGQPSAQRNKFSQEKKEHIAEDLERFHFLPQALSIKEAVAIDDQIAGCPINEELFIKTFEKYLYEQNEKSKTEQASK